MRISFLVASGRLNANHIASLAAAAALTGIAGCGSDTSSGGTNGLNGAGGTPIILGTGGVGQNNGGGNNVGGAGSYSLPPGFTGTEHGGYKLGDSFTTTIPSTADAGATQNGCSSILGVVRDFKGVNEQGGHPDFEAFSGDKETLGLVENTLGTDQKPVYTGICEATTTGTCPYGQQTTTQANFDQWYRYAANVNKPYVVYFSLAPNNGVYTFQSDAFFPLDGAGWGNTANEQHNFGFTTEVHTQFLYNGGETFTFIGDDDVWVFINGKLAVDLGGLHPSRTGTIDLTPNEGKLGITTGNTYNLDLFHAERHTNASHFRIDTNLAFTNCGTIVNEPPPR